MDDEFSLPLVDLTGAANRGSSGQRGGAAPTMGRGLQPEQPSGWKGQVPGAACVSTNFTVALNVSTNFTVALNVNFTRTSAAYAASRESH